MDDRMLQFVNLLTGRKLEHFCCEAEILDFGFGTLVLHAMGCTRVIKDNDILVTTIDYQSWDQEESTHNDEWFNMGSEIPTTIARSMAFVFITIPQAAKGISVPYFVNAP